MVFGFLKNTFTKLYTQITSPLKALFAAPIDQKAIDQLETILLNADTGITTTKYLIQKVTHAWQRGSLQEGTDLKNLLHEELNSLLAGARYQESSPIFLLVGINGSGKTTSAAKLAHYYKAENKKVLLVAADTFRAAATQQLEQWATTLGIDVVTGKANQDPASVVFAGIQKYKHEHYEVLIIDTAGRLQTKINLMKELEKIKRVIATQLPQQAITTLITIDAMLGQNSFEQAKLFHEATPIDGVILTKMDGTGKGGIIFAISKELHIPIAYISYGEKVDQLKQFNAQDFVMDLLND